MTMKSEIVVERKSQRSGRRKSAKELFKIMKDNGIEATPEGSLYRTRRLEEKKLKRTVDALRELEAFGG